MSIVGKIGAVVMLSAIMVAGFALAGPEGLTRDLDLLPAAPPPDFVVYYFHNHIRCEACRSMETMAAETVDYDFIDAVTAGRLVMREVDVQDEGNEHFVAEFELDGPTLILTQQDTTGRVLTWKNLDRIWELVDQPVAYRKYVRENLQAFMAEAGAGKG